MNTNKIFVIQWVTKNTFTLEVNLHELRID